MPEKFRPYVKPYPSLRLTKPFLMDDYELLKENVHFQFAKKCLARKVNWLVIGCSLYVLKDHIEEAKEIIHGCNTDCQNSIS